MDHDQEIAELRSPLRLKQSSKGTCQENFTTVRGCFGLGTARVKALGEWKKERKKEERKKKKEENENDETRYSPFPGSSL